MKRRDSNPREVKIDGVVAYQFTPRLSISFCWVKPEDVEKLLSVQINICCGKIAQEFFLANLLDVCLWETGERCK